MCIVSFDMASSKSFVKNTYNNLQLLFCLIERLILQVGLLKFFGLHSVCQEGTRITEHL